jgi:hypothetical protein
MDVATKHRRPAISFAEMKTFLSIGWGERGEVVAETWRVFNKRHFKNALEPIPIILVSTSPFGTWGGCTLCNVAERRAHLIQLTMPSKGKALRSDRGTLLHEMLHQHLTEQGEDPGHNKQAWRDGIMRLHFDITGERIWAAKQTVGKVREGEGSYRRSIRQQKPCPETGLPSLGQMAIATWPHSVGLKLGPF